LEIIKSHLLSGFFFSPPFRPALEPSKLPKQRFWWLLP